MIKIYRNFQNYSVEPFIVAAIWQQCVIKDQTGDFSFIYGSVLGLSVWLAYSIDRFFEPVYETSHSSERYQVLQKIKKAFLVIWFSFILVNLYLIILHLSVFVIVFGLALILCVIVNQYLSIIETKYFAVSFFSKEFRTTILFSLGILFFPAVDIGMKIQDMLIVLALLINSIFLNCAITSFFERKYDIKRNSLSFLQVSKKRLRKSIVTMVIFFLIIFPFVAIKKNYNTIIDAYLFTFPSLLVVLFINSTIDNKRRITDTILWVVPLITLIFISDI